MSDSTESVAARGSFFDVLAQALAQGGEASQLVPGLHQQLVTRVAGLCSMLVEADPETTHFVGTSAYGAFPDAVRLSDADIRAIERGLTEQPAVVLPDLRSTHPPLAHALGAPVAVIARVPQPDVLILLVVGLPAAARAPDSSAAVEAAGVFAVALECSRLRRTSEMQRRLRELVLVFSRGATSSRSLSSGFEALCLGVNAVFGAGRTGIWIHNRRARRLALEGSSDAASLAARPDVAVDDPQSTVARGLRLDRPEFVFAIGAPPSLVIPLRGRRRALGTLVIEGTAGPPSERAMLLDGARDLGRQLSSVIDNVQLLSEVLRSRRELEDTFNSLADLVVVCDRSGQIVYANQAFTERVGRTTDQLRDQVFADFVNPELGTWVRTHSATSASRSLTAPTRQFEDSRLGGTFLVTVTALISQEELNTGAVVVVRDVTEQARLEAERAALRLQLAQSEKLAALGQFVAGIAHELNNPLQGVLGHLELMKATGELTRRQRHNVQTIYREADRAAKIVSSLLVFAGSGQRVRRRCSLNTILSRALSLRAARLGKARITIVRRLDARQPQLIADPVLLQQAFFNIILNAEHAMSDGPGQLEVSSSLSRNREWAIVRVRDTGPGLSPEVVSRIFEPFFTTKEVGRGTGLGLAITYGIIQDHSGQIRAETIPKGGALFTIELPTDKLVIK